MAGQGVKTILTCNDLSFHEVTAWGNRISPVSAWRDVTVFSRLITTCE